MWSSHKRVMRDAARDGTLRGCASEMRDEKSRTDRCMIMYEYRSITTCSLVMLFKASLPLTRPRSCPFFWDAQQPPPASPIYSLCRDPPLLTVSCFRARGDTVLVSALGYRPPLLSHHRPFGTLSHHQQLDLTLTHLTRKLGLSSPPTS